MPRAPVPLQNIYPYSLTARSNNKEWFDIPMDRCWSIFRECIEKTTKMYGIETHCFVLMSNHFHWLVTTPNANLGLAMRYFMTESSRRLARASHRINKIYGARYKQNLIQAPAYFSNSVRYYYQNPVRAGICKSVEEYRWSTLRPGMGIELASANGMDMFIPESPRERLIWLNTLPDPKYNEIMRSALRRNVFKYPVHPSTKRRH